MCLRGRRGWVREERVSLYFSTWCFFHVSVLDVKGGIRYTLMVCSIKSGCESHSWFGNLSCSFSYFLFLRHRCVFFPPFFFLFPFSFFCFFVHLFAYNFPYQEFILWEYVAYFRENTERADLSVWEIFIRVYINRKVM